jgi:pimeloyl-ACP methyl ester carboxylesterase
MAERSRFRRRVGLALKVTAAALLVATLAGAIYEQAGRRRDTRRLPQVGRSVDIGGRTLNLYCSGEGTPTVILDSGNGDPGFAWSHIQPEIARLTRACWYDRAGDGWSDPGPFPRTSEAMARDLHEDEPRRAPDFMLSPFQPPRYLWRPIWIAAQAARAVGLSRLTTPRVEHEIQPKLARLSTRDRQVIVTESGHRIHEEAPQAVIAAVREVVAEVRGLVAVSTER